MNSKQKPSIILMVTKSGFWEGNETNSDLVPPIGLLAVASFLISKYDVKIIDQRFKGWKELLDENLKNNPIFVGISIMTGIQIKYSLEVCDYIKKTSDVKIVVGGVHPTLLPEQTLSNNLIDFIVLGEGEKAMVELADALRENGDLHKIKGIAFKVDGKYYKTPDRELMNLEKLPPLPYYLLNRSILDYDSVLKYGLYLVTSRGCPYRCTYCYNKLFNRGVWRKKSADNVVYEIEHYRKKYKINHFHILDDNFFVDLDWSREIIERLIEIDSNIRLEFQGVRADSICRMDNNFFILFKKLKDFTVRVGIESGSQRTLDLVNKNVTLEQYEKANDLLAKHKIRSYYNFMIGFPFETDEDLKKTTKFAVKLMQQNPYARIDFMAIYQPYPGTSLYNECIKNGYFKKPAKLEDWAIINWDEVNLSCFSKKRIRLLENIHISSYGLLIRKKSGLKRLPFYLRPIARAWSFVEKFRLKHFFFGLFFVERFAYYYNRDLFFKKDYLKK